MIITIDGPAGTGKSTVARAVAEKLGFDFLDTGAMYRAIGLEAVRRRANLEDQREQAFIARRIRVEFDWAKRPPTVLLNGEPVGHLVRGGEATRAASYVATVPAIREIMVRQQQQIGRERPDLVTEGRDQGSVVFADSPCKFFLTAGVQTRAARRLAELTGRGMHATLEQVIEDIEIRDHRDATREVGPLLRPDDAIVVETDGLSPEQVIDRLEAEVRRCRRG